MLHRGQAHGQRQRDAEEQRVMGHRGQLRALAQLEPLRVPEQLD